MRLLRKTQSKFTRLINNKYFSEKFLILKFLFRELEQFYSSSSLSSKKNFFSSLSSSSSWAKPNFLEFEFKFAALVLPIIGLVEWIERLVYCNDKVGCDSRSGQTKD